MPQTKHIEVPVEFKDGADGSGDVVARFSVFDIVDRDGDILRRSAFTDGQPVPMVWAHQWDQPIGKGVVLVKGDHAEFHGQFLSTASAQEARTAVREMGALQQWSFAFRITNTKDNQDIRGRDITGAEVFEVSPVLVGANQETATLAVKSAEPDVKDMSDVMSSMGDLTAAELRRVRERCDELLADMEAETHEETAGKEASAAQELIERERLELEALSLEEVA